MAPRAAWAEWAAWTCKDCRSGFSPALRDPKKPRSGGAFLLWRMNSQGAGPTGLMLANQLVLRGVRVQIIERHPGPVVADPGARRAGAHARDFPGAPYEHVFFVADVTATGSMVADEVNVYLWRRGLSPLLSDARPGSLAHRRHRAAAAARARRAGSRGRDAVADRPGRVEPVDRSMLLVFDVPDSSSRGCAPSRSALFPARRCRARAQPRRRQGMNTGLQDSRDSDYCRKRGGAGPRAHPAIRVLPAASRWLRRPLR